MNQKERVITALENKEPDFVPIFEWDVNRKISKKICGSEDILDLVDFLDLDAVVFRPNYNYEFVKENIIIDEWGLRKKITQENYPIVIESPIKDIRNYKDYKFPDTYASQRFQQIEQAINRFGESKAIILNLRDIFSDMRDLLGYENALITLMTDQENWRKLLNLCIEYNRTLAEIAHKKYNINIIVTTDDIAGSNGLIFNPKIFYEFLGPKFREVIKGFRDIGYYCIKHCDGNIIQIIDYFIDSGIHCIDPIDPSAGMDIYAIKEKYGKRVCIKGNINCLTTLVNGKKEDIEIEVKKRISRVGRGGGYILSSSNMIHSGVKSENFKAMVKYTRQYGKYPIETNGSS